MNKKPWLAAASWLLLGSLATLGFKKPVLLAGLNLNDILLLISSAFLAISILKKELVPNIPKRVLVLIGLGLGSVILGSILSIFVFHAVPTLALREYMRLGACVLAFLGIYTISGSDDSFVTKSAVAIAALPTLLLPFLFYGPWQATVFALDISLSRFSGFLIDPNYFASFQLVVFFCAAWIVWKIIDHGSLARRLFGIIGGITALSFILGSVLWSGSRGGILAGAASIVLILTYLIIMRPGRKAFILGGVIATAFFGSFFVLTRQGRTDVVVRLDHISAPEASGIEKIAARQGRSEIWKNAAMPILKNPLGYGPGYNEVVDIRGDNGKHHMFVHNTILQLLLIGGIVLLAVTLVGTIHLTVTGLVTGTPLSLHHFLVFGLIATCITALFIDSFFSRWIWVCLGLIAASVSQQKSRS